MPTLQARAMLADTQGSAQSWIRSISQHSGMRPSIQRRVHKVPRLPAAIAGARPRAPSVEVLESVMRLTTERKREALVCALVRTMREVLPATRIEFHPCDPTGDEASPPRPDARSGQRARDLALCLDR